MNARWRLGHAPLLFEGAALLGHSLYLLKLGRATRICLDGQPVWRKRRHWYAPLIVATGNRVSRILGCGLYGLHETEWFAWEEALSPLCADGQTRRDARSLISTQLPGIPLREALQGNSPIEALSAVLHELRHLHQIPMSFPDGREGLWSHGDAHAGNVFFEATTGIVRWFDFECVHDVALPAARRHADDLCALLFSSAVYLPEKQWNTAVLRAHEVYPDELVWCEVRLLVSRLEAWPDVVHLGHAHLSRRRHARFSKLLKGCTNKTACG